VNEVDTDLATPAEVGVIDSTTSAASAISTDVVPVFAPLGSISTRPRSAAPQASSCCST
jgi:hypothetical protein